MKVIVFLAILGLCLAGLRGDKRKVPHSVPHSIPHHHATHHRAVPHSIPHHHATHHASHHASGHSSNSENSEELFSVAAAIQAGIADAIQGTTDTITADLQGTADTINGALQGTAATICNNVQGVLCDDAEGTADTIGGDIVGTADTLTPIINATGSDTAYATQKLNTTQVVDDVNEGVSTVETGLTTAGDVMHIVQKGLSIAGAAGAFSFVDLQGIIQNDIQGTIDTIQGDIQGTVDTIQGDLQGTANTVTQAVESITPAEAAATGNAIASTIGTGLVIGNDALKDVNDGLSIANSVIP